MAIIYRYEIANKKMREKIDLSSEEDIKDNIEETIEGFFGNSLKDVFVYDKYFEFRLYDRASSDRLRILFKLLLSRTYIIKNEIDGYYAGKSYSKKRYFSRMKQLFYGFAEINEDEITLELIDSIDFENYGRLKVKAEKFYQNLSKDDLKQLNILEDTALVDKIKMFLYLDIAVLKFDKKDFPESRNSIYLIEGYQRQKNWKNSDGNTYEIFYEKDLTNFSYSSGNISSDGYNTNSFYIKDVIPDVPVPNEVLNLNIMESINEGNIVSILNEISFNKSESLTFKVHNVGQGLMTTIQRGNKCVLCFDFGCGIYRNAKTFHDYMKKVIDFTNVPIFLSHVHADHWGALNHYRSALKAKWYIPKQEVTISFNKKVAEITACGGSVEILSDHIISGDLRIVQNNDCSKNKHKNGNILILCFNKNNNKIKIVVPGDQYYDKIDENHLADIDILVATHHGGKPISNTANISEFILNNKGNTKDMTIVYSYGRDNSHKHPIKDQYTYLQASEFDICKKDSDFEITGYMKI